MRVCLHGGPRDGETHELGGGYALEIAGMVPTVGPVAVGDMPQISYRTGRYEFLAPVGPGDHDAEACMTWAGWSEPVLARNGGWNWCGRWDWREEYGTVTITNDARAAGTGWSPDESGGMLLEELLDQSTLDWLEKVKARKA